MNNIVPIGAKPMSEDNVSNILLGLFLNYEFWKDHHYMVSENYFEKESKKIFQTISMSHEKYLRSYTLAAPLVLNSFENDLQCDLQTQESIDP